MKTLVEIIQEFNDNVKELEQEQKRINKALKELEEERENVIANIAMYKNIVDQLTATKNKEISKTLQAHTEKPVEQKKQEEKHTKHKGSKQTVYAKDEHGNVIAEYGSINEAARDLKLPYTTVYSALVGKSSHKTQLKKHGFYVEF